jgi:hypothetical protein
VITSEILNTCVYQDLLCLSISEASSIQYIYYTKIYLNEIPKFQLLDTVHHKSWAYGYARLINLYSSFVNRFFGIPRRPSYQTSLTSVKHFTYTMAWNAYSSLLCSKFNSRTHERDIRMKCQKEFILL